MIVTEDVIQSWFNPDKKGIIVFGMMRSGTQWLSTLVQKIFEPLGKHVVFNGELPKDSKWQQWESPQLVLPEFTNATKGSFSVTSVALPQVLPWMFNYAPNFDIIKRDFTLIKILRTNISEHLMSLSIYNQTQIHSSITPALLENIQYPREITRFDLNKYMVDRQYVHSLFADHTVNYEDISVNITAKNMVKNKYGITPKEFFVNYDFIHLMETEWLAQHN